MNSHFRLCSDGLDFYPLIEILETLVLSIDSSIFIDKANEIMNIHFTYVKRTR